MNSTPTAHHVEIWPGTRATETIPVSRLRPGDRVFDQQGDPHPLVSAEPGTAGSAWVKRADLDYAEHLFGAILVDRSPAARSRATSSAG